MAGEKNGVPGSWSFYSPMGRSQWSRSTHRRKTSAITVARVRTVRPWKQVTRVLVKFPLAELRARARVVYCQTLPDGTFAGSEVSGAHICMGHPVTHRRNLRSHLDAAAVRRPPGYARSHAALGNNVLGRKTRNTEGYVARVFKFVDILGRELHTITDPEDKLPIPANAQEVSIGPITMRVESVRTVGSSTNPRIPTVYYVRVRVQTPAANA